MPAEFRSSQTVQPFRSNGLARFDTMRCVVRAVATVPFDALRFAYAAFVQAGLVRRSILASRAVELQLDALEKVVLGPLARTVHDPFGTTDGAY